MSSFVEYNRMLILYWIESLSYAYSLFFQRWQRRFFVLYDDGELAYSVDENVSLIYVSSLL